MLPLCMLLLGMLLHLRAAGRLLLCMLMETTYARFASRTHTRTTSAFAIFSRPLMTTLAT